MKTQTFLAEKVTIAVPLSFFLRTFAPMNYRLDYQTVCFGPAVRKDCVATVGMFDGVHTGHQFVAGHVCRRARERGLLPAVVTFHQPPRQVLQPGWHPQLLCSPEEKLALLRQTGIGCCFVLAFSRDMAALSAYDFMRLMRDKMHVRVLLTGYDNRFGHRCNESFEDYARYGHELGIEVESLPPAPAGEDGCRASSSHVRQLLCEGHVGEAARCLGRYYTLAGTVVSGEHIGRQLGFPTANLRPDCADQLVPAAGAYAVRVRIEGVNELLEGMTNIGTRPTFDGQQTTLETHIFGFSGNVYGRRINISFIARLRDEHPFSSAEALTTQLRQDAAKAMNILSTHKT